MRTSVGHLTAFGIGSEVVIVDIRTGSIPGSVLSTRDIPYLSWSGDGNRTVWTTETGDLRSFNLSQRLPGGSIRLLEVDYDLLPGTVSGSEVTRV